MTPKVAAGLPVSRQIVDGRLGAAERAGELEASEGLGRAGHRRLSSLSVTASFHTSIVLSTYVAIKGLVQNFFVQLTYRGCDGYNPGVASVREG